MSRTSFNLFDSHAHFDDDSFEHDRELALERAREVGVTRQIVPAVSADTWPRLRRVCAAHPGLYPAYGLHPYYLGQHRREHLGELENWLEREKPVAVGEIGLDYFIPELDRDAQIGFFKDQLKIARNFDLPVIIHARRAVDDVAKYLRQIPDLRGMVHSFAGSVDQAGRLTDMGFYLSFGGPATYDRAKRLHKVIRELPLEFLLLETDSPDQPLSTHQGERNEPAYLAEVLQVVAALREQSPEVIAEATTANTLRLFRIEA